MSGLFPIHSDSFKEWRDSPRTFDWDALAKHEQQALRNHSQTLQRLAERGGCTWCELAAILEDRRYERMGQQEAYNRCMKFVEAKP